MCLVSRAQDQWDLPVREVHTCTTVCYEAGEPMYMKWLEPRYSVCVVNLDLNNIVVQGSLEETFESI